MPLLPPDTSPPARLEVASMRCKGLCTGQMSFGDQQYTTQRQDNDDTRDDVHDE